MTKHFYDVHLRHHVILRHVMVRHIIVLLCHVGDIYVFVSSCKCYSRLVNVCHGFVPSWFWYFCHSNVFHAHACHAIVCHAIVTSCKCLSCNRGHVNERPTSASSCVPRWLRFTFILNKNYKVFKLDPETTNSKYCKLTRNGEIFTYAHLSHFPFYSPAQYQGFDKEKA